MELKEIIEKAQQDVTELTRLSMSGVICGSKKNDGWHIGVELIEKRAIPDTQDLLGLYEVVLDDEGNLIKYERKRIRRRMDAEESIAD